MIDIASNHDIICAILQYWLIALFIWSCVCVYNITKLMYVDCKFHRKCLVGDIWLTTGLMAGTLLLGGLVWYHDIVHVFIPIYISMQWWYTMLLGYATTIILKSNKQSTTVINNGGE